jgi:hypothetical protein
MKGIRGDEEEDDEPEEGVHIEEGIPDGGQAVVHDELPEELADEGHRVGPRPCHLCGVLDDDPCNDGPDQELHEGSLRFHQGDDIEVALYKCFNDPGRADTIILGKILGKWQNPLFVLSRKLQ